MKFCDFWYNSSSSKSSGNDNKKNLVSAEGLSDGINVGMRKSTITFTKYQKQNFVWIYTVILMKVFVHE